MSFYLSDNRDYQINESDISRISNDENNFFSDERDSINNTAEHYSDNRDQYVQSG